MLVGRGEESSTRATISSLMVLITNNRRSTGRRTRGRSEGQYVKTGNHDHCRDDEHMYLPYSVLSPQSFTLFASYWAFFFKRQALQNTPDEWSSLIHPFSNSYSYSTGVSMIIRVILYVCACLTAMPACSSPCGTAVVRSAAARSRGSSR